MIQWFKNILLLLVVIVTLFAIMWQPSDAREPPRKVYKRELTQTADDRKLLCLVGKNRIQLQRGNLRSVRGRVETIRRIQDARRMIRDNC